ncbi:MAG: hypothetical protein ACTHJK_03850 [Sphingomicrobium sp.]
MDDGGKRKRELRLLVEFISQQRRSQVIRQALDWEAQHRKEGEYQPREDIGKQQPIIDCQQAGCEAFGGETLDQQREAAQLKQTKRQLASQTDRGRSYWR